MFNYLKFNSKLIGTAATNKEKKKISLIQLFISSICKQFNPQSAKATQNKLFKNANQAMEEEDYDFIRLFTIFCDFSRLNLQTIQALKAKNNPKQAHPKCSSNSSSSITQQKIPHTSSSNIQTSDKSSTILGSKFFRFNSSSHCINTQKANISIKPIQKK